MTVTLELPDEIAQALGTEGDISRRLLESLAIESYRRETITQMQVGKLLNLSRIETENFLAQHVDLIDYDPSEFQREIEALDRHFERVGVDGRF